LKTWRPVALALFLCAILPVALLSAAFQSDKVITETILLYDGCLESTPNQQGFSYLAVGQSASRLSVGGVTVLDTTGEISDQAGYFSREEHPLDRRLGFKLHFTMQIGEEEHLSSHRAGFSVIVLSDDLQGLELAFWEDEIWAQEGGSADSLFTHAEGTSFDTTSDLTTYELSVRNDTYSLSTGGTPILSGPLRDYTAFDGFPDIYESPGLIFLGDNSTRAAAKTAVSFVALETNLPIAATATRPATTIPRPTVSATPHPADKLYMWHSCLKGVDVDARK